MQYQEDYEEEYFEYPSDAADYDDKRKRLMQSGYQAQYQGKPVNSSRAEVVAWAVIGTIGIILAIGSTVIAATSSYNDGEIMLIPLAYMIAMVWLMRRR